MTRPEVLVADIQALVANRKEQRFAIQEKMVELRDQHHWTQRRIAEETGMPKSTVDRWLQAWDEQIEAGILPQVGQKKLTPLSDQARSDRAVARRVLETGSPEDRVEMATKLLDDPVVAKAAVKAALATSPEARSAITTVMYDHNADKRRRQHEQAEQRRADRALPLPTYMAKMVEKMNEWSLGLAGMYDDLDTLPEGRGAELVAIAAGNLAEQAQRWVDKLNPRPELKVIEGRARTTASA